MLERTRAFGPALVKHILHPEARSERVTHATAPFEILKESLNTVGYKHSAGRFLAERRARGELAMPLFPTVEETIYADILARLRHNATKIPDALVPDIEDMTSIISSFCIKRLQDSTQLHVSLRRLPSDPLETVVNMQKAGLIGKTQDHLRFFYLTPQIDPLLHKGILI